MIDVPLGQLLAIYGVAIVAGSLFGGFLPRFLRLTHTRIQLLMSLVGGLMLGIAVFHLIPHAVVLAGPGRVDLIAWSLMFGMLIMFFLLRTFHFHQHDPNAPAAVCEHDHDHDDPVGPPQPPDAHRHKSGRHLHWSGVAFGLALHTFLDGVALGASMQAESTETHGHSLPGLATFLAIALHKPLDAVSIASLMRVSGLSTGWQARVNFGFALMCPLGAAAALMGFKMMGDTQAIWVAAAMAFSAGVFLCISLGDLLPEMEIHSHNRVRLSAALLIGISLAWGIGWLEPEHSHLPERPTTEVGDDQNSSTRIE